MNETLMECFLHPIKCKILLTVHSKKRVTAKQLTEIHKGISQATLYRYLKKMTDDGVLEIISQVPVRGVTEKVYGIGMELETAVDVKAMLKDNSGEAYLQLFQQYLIGLLGEFQQYVISGDIDIIHDGSGFSTCPVYATAKELEELMKAIGDLLEPLRNNEPSEQRKAHSVGVVLTPPRK